MDPSFPEFANAETIQTDLACVRCGYNLRTLKQDANCPECGEAVRQTLDALLWLMDMRWLKSVSDGLIWLGLWIVLTVVIAWLCIVGIDAGQIPYRRRLSLEDVLVWAACVGPQILIGICLWWITTKGDYTRLSLRHVITRSIVRITAVGRIVLWWLVVTLVILYSDYTSPRWQVDLRPRLPSDEAIIAALLATELTCWFCLLLYLCRLYFTLHKRSKWLPYAAMAAMLVLIINFVGWRVHLVTGTLPYEEWGVASILLCVPAVLILITLICLRLGFSMSKLRVSIQSS